MHFSGKHDEVVDIIVSIKIHVGKNKDGCHYACNILYYITGKWYNFDDDTITNYSEYP